MLSFYKPSAEEIREYANRTGREAFGAKHYLTVLKLQRGVHAGEEGALQAAVEYWLERQIRNYE